MFGVLHCGGGEHGPAVAPLTPDEAGARQPILDDAGAADAASGCATTRSCADQAPCTQDTDCASGYCRDVGSKKECVPAPSCTGNTGASFDCGRDGKESCCLSHKVPGGTFNRFNNAMYPAKVSAFR